MITEGVKFAADTLASSIQAGQHYAIASDVNALGWSLGATLNVGDLSPDMRALYLLTLIIKELP